MKKAILYNLNQFFEYYDLKILELCFEKKLKILLLKLNDALTKIGLQDFYFLRNHYDQQFLISHSIDFLLKFEKVFGYPQMLHSQELKQLK